MNDDTTIKTLRAMAWERAKGELRSVLTTYHDDDNFDRANEEIEGFIKRIDDEGLAE